MQCPYCKKDLQYAIRLLGHEAFLMHVRAHEVDLINHIFSAIESISWHYKTKPFDTMLGVVKLLLDEYNELKKFHEIIKESQNENSKEKEIS